MLPAQPTFSFPGVADCRTSTFVWYGRGARARPGRGGPVAGVRTVLHYLYPPMRYVRYSSIFKVYWQLALALAAGLGLSRLSDAPGERKTAFAILTGWACLALPAAIALRAGIASHGAVPEALFPRAYLPAALILPAALVAEEAGETRQQQLQTSLDTLGAKSDQTAADLADTRSSLQGTLQASREALTGQTDGLAGGHGGVSAFALTEPNAGSDPARQTTRAVRERDGWVLNGRKRFITSGRNGGLIIVTAKTDDLEQGNGN